MSKYLEGRCPECSARNAAAIHMEFDTDKTWKKTRQEFIKSGLIVTEIVTDQRITIEGCFDGCSIGDAHRTEREMMVKFKV